MRNDRSDPTPLVRSSIDLGLKGEPPSRVDREGGAMYSCVVRGVIRCGKLVAGINEK